MIEIEFKTRIFYDGKIKKNLGGFYDVSDFTVWVEVAGNDIEITKSLTVDELKAAKNDFLDKFEIEKDEKYLETRSSEQIKDDIVNELSDRFHDEFKAEKIS